MNLFDWIVKLTEEYWELFLNGTKNTLIMSLTGTIIGFLIGLVIAIIRTIPTTKNTNPVFKALLGAVNFVLNAYIEIIRGTPMMVQALIIHYSLFVPMGVSKIGDGILSAIIIISFNTGAYMAEIVRGGIISVDKGQFEGAHAIGMNHFQTMYHVVLPQVIRNIMPSIGNEFVVNIKDSSVLNIVAITELMFVAKQAGGTYAKPVPAYIIAAIIYFVLTFTVTRILRLCEKKLAGSDSYTICGSQSDPNAEIHVKKEEKVFR